MELFKSETLNEEYKELVNEILPKVLQCSYCNVLSCELHKKFNISCNLCRQLRCRSCFAFNISRETLPASDEEQKSYLNCFITDFLNLSDESIGHYFPDIKVEHLDREKVFFKKSYVKSEKNHPQVVNQKLPSNVKKITYQNGRWKRRVFYKVLERHGGGRLELAAEFSAISLQMGILFKCEYHFEFSKDLARKLLLHM